MARAQGTTFSRYERIGYTRFRLHEVVFVRNQVRVSVDRVEANTPVFWLLAARRDVTAGAWKVEVERATTPVARSGDRVASLPALHLRLEKVASVLARWLPSAHLGPGEVRWPGQTLALQRAEWRDRQLTVDQLRWQELAGAVTASWPAEGPATVRIVVPSGSLTLAWSGAAVKGSGVLEGQPLVIEALFPPDRWLPQSAELTAEDWELPAKQLKLASDYSVVRGRAHLAWSQDRFVVSAQAAASPSDTGSNTPPLEARIEAQGDLRALTVTALNVTAPFATANLSAPVALDYREGFRAGVAQLTVQADLAKQPWFPVRGQINGVVGVDASGRQDFSLQCDGIQFRDFALQRAEARGTLEWPRLEVAELILRPDDQNRATARGTIDLVKRELFAGTLLAQLAGGWMERWLPADVRWSRADISATVAGPLVALQHSGKATIAGADLPVLHVMNVEFFWRGQGEAVDEFTARATSSGATLEAAGALSPKELSLRTFTLARNGQTPWTLAAPASISWAPEFQIGPLRLEHANGFLSVTGNRGASGSWRLEAANIDSALVRDWMELSGPDWRVNALQSEGRLVDGKLEFALQLTGQTTVESQSADVRVLAHGDGKGVQLDELSTTLGERAVTRASGHIPVIWDTNATPHLQPDWNSPLTITFNTTPDSPFWSLLAGFAGVTVENPVAEAQLGGTLENPTAALRVQASRVAMAKGELNERIPEITDLALEARADRHGLSIEKFHALIDGQKVQAHGRLPTGRDDWEKLRDAPLPFLWSHGEGHIELTDADLARLAKRAPDFMAAQGRLSAQLDLAAGGALSGELRLNNAALRPIDPLGTVQEINADLVLRDRQLEIKSWAAKIGGEPVELRGTITLPETGQPRVALELQGNNLPLVRRTGLIVRSDIALKATTGSNDVTEVSGLVTLRDSVVLADLSVLRPTGQSTAKLRPPFFSVDVLPFRDWSLAVDLRGAQAVKIRMPVFTGVASARFRLSGTLGEPRAVGELTVDEGRVLFPFATFDVRLGSVRLSEADPYHAQLNVNAQSRYHDYLLHLDATGPLDAPQIVMSSNPPLDATQLLLMVTSGQAPETDVAAASGTQRLARLGTYFGQSVLFGSGTDENRIELSSGSRVSRQGKETYEFTYRLNEKWALVGDYDEYDEYNAGVKWRAYVQEGDKSDKK